MKLFIAGLDTETNTFSPMQTGLEAFSENLIAYGDATQKPLNCCSSQLLSGAMPHKKAGALLKACALSQNRAGELHVQSMNISVKQFSMI